MKKMMIVIMASTILVTSCGASKNVTSKPKTEVVSGEKDPLMKLLVSALIIYSLNIMLTR